ncbi:MAG: NAD(P)/FAD-dependent oxidoreductase [Candidatus Pacearchaeota archaeon]
MLYDNWLHTGALNLKTPYCPPLKDNLTTECLVIGGGITGLHAALRLVENGKKVVLLEKRICGSSSSGQSAGFLTPESEEDMRQLINKHGIKKAKTLYNVPFEGVKLIVETINKNGFKCDLRKQDSLYLSVKKSHDSLIEEEAEVRKEMNLPFQLLDEKGLKKYHPGIGYRKGVKYSGSYGINSFAYCQEMKTLLIRKGVKIYEDTEVLNLEKNIAKTHLGYVKAKNIIICIDKMKKEFNNEISRKFYHLQTYLTISEPLSDEEMKSVFPNGELMCWDTNLVYLHYRPVAGNRILVGGSSPWATYYPEYYHSSRIIQPFINELKRKFPKIKNVEFTHYWSGLIDSTQDLTPIADYDKNNKSIQYAMGCAGLNWAAYCGDYLARRVIAPEKVEDLTEFLGANRKFFVPNWIQRILGKRITFAIGNLREMMK